MNIYTPMPSKAVQAEAAAGASAWPSRTATVEYNEWQRFPWMLRCYGAGRCTSAKGMPCYYSTEDHARHVAAAWIETGVAPADQQVAS